MKRWRGRLKKSILYLILLTIVYFLLSYHISETLFMVSFNTQAKYHEGVRVWPIFNTTVYSNNNELDITNLYGIEIYNIHSLQPCDVSPFILLALNSHAQHRDRRQSIRQSWGATVTIDNPSDEYSVLWKTVFVVGKMDKKEIMTSVYQEAAKYDDMIIANIHESHRTLTNKTVLGMLWAKYYCPPAFFFKGDDDIWVNQFKLFKFAAAANQSHFINRFWKGFVAVDNRKPIRRKSSKYYLSPKEFAGDTFPPFCSGFAYIMSGIVLQAMVDIIDQVKKIPIVDDVYVGFLGEKIGVRPVAEVGFHLRSWYRDVKKEVISSLAKHRVTSLNEQMLLTTISYQHFTNQICSGSPHKNVDYINEFHCFYFVRFSKRFRCNSNNHSKTITWKRRKDSNSSSA